MKKTKFMTRLGAVVFALAILFAMAVPVFADSTTTYDSKTDAYTTGSNPNPNPATNGIVGTQAIPLTKTIVMFNTTDATSVREPDISFTYAVVPHDPDGATVTNGTDSVAVEQGPANGVATSLTLAFNKNTPHQVTTTGTRVEVTDSLAVDLTKFTHAGVFRYKITETPTADVTSVGLEDRETDYDSTRYLDVYINNPDGQTYTERYLAGAVIFKTTSTNTTTYGAGEDSIDTSFEKTTGFEPGPGTPTQGGSNDYTDDASVDRYFTYNVDVTKEITGNLANKSHAFPFSVEIAGSLNTAVVVDVNDKGSTSTGSVSSGAHFTGTTTLADGQTYSVLGLPKGSTITVTETNNTTDTYKLTTTFTGTTTTSTKIDSELAARATDGESNVLINSGNAASVEAKENTVIKFTNHLSDLSPTGLAFRVAPYALMLTAAVSMILLFAKRRREVTDMI